MPRSELTTKDGVPIDDLLERARQIIDIYRDSERPFRDMFATTTDSQTFFAEAPQDDVYWDKIAEGEHPRTVVDDENEGKWITIRGDTYSKALGMTREYVQKSTEEDVLRKLQTMLEGAKNTEDRLIREVFKAGIADGRDLWYNVPDYGAHSFNDTHDHTFADTQELFGDSNAYTAREHLEEAKEEMTHHGFDGPFVALGSTGFKRQLRDEITWDADYHIPMATNMRSADVLDLDIIYDNIRFIESPWMTGDQFYLTQVDNEGPVKFYEDEPVTLTRPNGATVESPGDLLGANGYARFGCRFVDPLRAVDVTADNLA
jgi:hypothetical protein